MAEPRELTAADLAGMQMRANMAAPAPWDVIVPSSPAQVIAILSFHEPEATAYCVASDWTQRGHDASFIAHAREDVPALLAHAAALQQRVDRAEAALLQMAENPTCEGDDYCAHCDGGWGTHLNRFEHELECPMRVALALAAARSEVD